MPENRFFSEKTFQTKELIPLEDEEFHHLRVMRLREKDTLELVNGRNQLAYGHIEKLQKNQALIKLTQIVEKDPPSRQLILAQALPKPKNLEWIVEKGTELGATSFWLFPTTKSEKRHLSESQLHRLENILISSMKQCGRLDLPTLVEKPPLFEWKPLPFPSYFGDPNSTHPPTNTTENTLIFIGPEGGFTEEEHHYLSNTLKSNGIRLNQNTLRAETAAICALSLFAL